VTVGVKHHYRYGESEIVGFDGAWRREVYRPFSVAANEPWNAEIQERTMCDGPNDDSARHDKLAAYDSKCSCCWLNISHTIRLHGARIA